VYGSTSAARTPSSGSTACVLAGFGTNTRPEPPTSGLLVWNPSRTVANPVSARLGDLTGPDAGRCRELRSELGIDASDDAPAFVRGDGTPVPAPELARFARMASLTATSLETNGGVCRSLLQVRYGTEEVAA